MNHPLRILVLEDQRVDAEIMAAELKASGLLFYWWRVDTEDEFIEALSIPPDLIIADYNLPDYSALEALAHLRRHELDIPFIIVSGMIDETTALETITLGATDYLFKDRLGRLKFAVERALAERVFRNRHSALQRHFLEEMEKYREFVEGTEDLVVQIDTEGRYIFVNRMVEKYLGLSVAECLGMPAFEFVHPEDRESTRTAFAEWVDRRLRNVTYSNRILSRRGAVFYLSWTINLHYDGKGRLLHLNAIAQDNTEQKNLQSRLHEALHTYESIVEASPAAIFAVSPDGTIMAWNRSAERVFGWTTEEAIGRINPSVIPEKMGEFRETMLQTLGGQGVFQKEVVRRTRDGRDIDISLSTAPLRDEKGQVRGVMAVVFDITDRKRYEEELEHRSNFDHLTGLPNRNLLSDRISQGIAHARRTGKKVALLLLDLDRFQIINDSLGHSLGNELLKRVAERLKTEVRSQDTLARIGGDEFVIVLQEVGKTGDAITALEKFRAILARPFAIGSRHLRVTASIGISLFPDDGQDEEALFRSADLAMYQAKSAGRDAFRIFAPEMDVRIVETMDLEADLRQALESEELILHFQPKVDVASGEVVGSEALVRWQHPRRGMVPPGSFIPLAEETGLIEPIGEWVLREACRRNKAFQEEGLSPVTVAVNISARQFRNEGFADMIAEVLNETGLEPRWLDLELTESMVMDHPEEAAAMMNRLKKTGISLSLDDFGIGYSSLNYLRRFPVDTLKIDRSFIADVERDPGSASVANSIIDIAHNLGTEAVAEGVETEEQLDFLRRCGCDKFQGFLFSRPVPAELFANLLRKGRPKTG